MIQAIILAARVQIATYPESSIHFLLSPGSSIVPGIGSRLAEARTDMPRDHAQQRVRRMQHHFSSVASWRDKRTAIGEMRPFLNTEEIAIRVVRHPSHGFYVMVTSGL